jgi:hypothetical protein
MKIITVIFLTILLVPCFAQAQKISWGKEIKLHNAVFNIELVLADETGMYINEGYTKTHMGKGAMEHYHLSKYDKVMNLVFENDFLKDYPNYALKAIIPMHNQLYAFCTNYDPDYGRLSLYGGKLNKNTGNLMGSLKELVYVNLSARDNCQFQIQQSADSTKVLVLARAIIEKVGHLKLAVIDTSLKWQKMREFSAPGGPLYKVSAFTLLPSDLLLVMAKEYEMVEDSKKKPVMQYKKYALDIFDTAGHRKHILEVSHDGKYIKQATVIVRNRSLNIAGFYSNSPKINEVNGVFTALIDTVTHSLSNYGSAPIALSMISEAYSEEAEKNKTRSEKKNDVEPDDEGADGYFTLAGAFCNADGSFTLVAERAYEYKTRGTQTTNTGGVINTSTTARVINERGNLLIIKTAPEGGISWMNALPKKQSQVYSSYSYSGSFTGISGPQAKIWPMYNSVGLMLPGPAKNQNIACSSVAVSATILFAI